MEKCHRYVLNLAPHLIKNKNAFKTNDKSAIESELNTILYKIDEIVHHTHDIDTLTRSIYDQDYPLSEVFREFYHIIIAYMNEPICRTGEREFINIFRTYLCSKGAKNLTILYHFIANIGIVKLGCTRLYLVDKSKSGKEAEIISSGEFLMQNILSTSYRLSKSKVEECIRAKYKKIGLSNILIARTLLSISRDFRSHVQKFCPIIYKNWTTQSKYQHEQFEKWLDKLIDVIDDVSQNLK
jgi:hypothetical protein